MFLQKGPQQIHINNSPYKKINSYQDFLEKPGNELNNTFGRLLSVLM